jgi:4-amino-4-deoxy-L-arabinose transferase-like glycosyltransferase
MKEFISQKIKNIPKAAWILLAILLVGFFLRTYNFHDWLRFNADQGRDSELVSSVVDGKVVWPLLGPKAGGTEFKLGGAFYYFEIVSAKIFGNAPDKMAYPDLLSGLLCIPLLFFLLRKYFDQKISLTLTAIFAVSNYAIRYARFAWNPNSTPFWTMLALYAMHKVVAEKSQRKALWAIVCGLAIGVGVQLHTTLLLFLPITTIIVFGYLAIKNIKIVRYFFIILVFSLLLNAPQLFGEYQSGGKNIQAFFGGVKTKQATESNFFDNALHGASCWVQGNLDIISGYEISDKCSFTLAAHKSDTLAFLLGLIFVVGGTILGFQAIRQEKDDEKQKLLFVLGVFMGVTFLVFLKLAFELSVRFYLILIFLPFFLAGFWLEFLKKKFQTKYTSLLLFGAIILIGGNLFFVQKYFAEFAAYGKGKGGNMDITILSEAETFARFILANSSDPKNAVIEGDAKFLFKAYKPVRYLVGRSGLELSQVNKKAPLPAQYFYLGTVKDREKFLKDPNVKVLQFQDYGDFAILSLSGN